MANITFFLQENISGAFLLLTAVILALCFKVCQTSNRLQKLQAKVCEFRRRVRRKPVGRTSHHNIARSSDG
jgi:hypothetical protein